MASTAERKRRWQVDLPALRRDRVLLGAALWTLLAIVLFGVLDGRTSRQVQVYWSFQPPVDALLAYSSWRVHRMATGAIRRFWLILAAAGTLFFSGDCFQTIMTYRQPGGWSTSGGVVQMGCLGLGVGVIVVAMLVHPHPGRTRRDRLAFWLDSATVLVGGAVVAWSFAIKPEQPGQVLGTISASGIALTAAFAAVKMVMSGNAPMHKAAALAMIGAAALTSLGIFLAPDENVRLSPAVYALRFMPTLLIAVGARAQETVARFDPTAFGERRRKPYSLLPYGSMAVAFAAMTTVLPHGSGMRLWGVVAGLGLICALVAGRQLAAFHDNTRLIKKLDATLAELREHEVRLRHQALFDGLTGLANRTQFHEEATAALAAAAGTPGTVSLLLIDLDGFKAVNDTLGHAAGDALLTGVAAKLRQAVRPSDLVARLGGDEFAVLLPDCAGLEGERTSQRILRALESPVPIDGRHVRASASIGVASAEHGDDVESLLRDADLAMYAAKHGGKGAWRRYDASMEKAVL